MVRNVGKQIIPGDITHFQWTTTPLPEGFHGFAHRLSSSSSLASWGKCLANTYVLPYDSDGAPQPVSRDEPNEQCILVQVRDGAYLSFQVRGLALLLSLMLLHGCRVWNEDNISPGHDGTEVRLRSTWLADLAFQSGTNKWFAIWPPRGFRCRFNQCQISVPNWCITNLDTGAHFYGYSHMCSDVNHHQKTSQQQSLHKSHITLT